MQMPNRQTTHMQAQSTKYKAERLQTPWSQENLKTKQTKITKHTQSKQILDPWTPGIETLNI